MKIVQKMYIRYFFEIGLSESIKENNTSKYLFHLYQLYSVNNENVRWTIEFIKFFMLNDNQKGMEFFEKRFVEVFNEPPDKFKLAGLYFDFNRFEKAKVHVLIFSINMKNLKNNMIIKKQE